MDRSRMNIMSKSFKDTVKLLGACTLLTGAVGLYSTSAKAEDWSVDLGGVSYHIGSNDTDTWFHRAVVVHKGDFSAGYLKNSYGQDSFVASYRIWSKEVSVARAEVSLGAVTGYDKCFGQFTNSEKESGKDKVNACFLPTFSVTFKTDTEIQPKLILWGNALVLIGNYEL